jgi:hypothetical protein
VRVLELCESWGPFPSYQEILLSPGSLFSRWMEARAEGTGKARPVVYGYPDTPSDSPLAFSSAVGPYAVRSGELEPAQAGSEETLWPRYLAILVLVFLAGKCSNGISLCSLAPSEFLQHFILNQGVRFKNYIAWLAYGLIHWCLVRQGTITLDIPGAWWFLSERLLRQYYHDQIIRELRRYWAALGRLLQRHPWARHYREARFIASYRLVTKKVWTPKSKAKAKARPRR